MATSCSAAWSVTCFLQRSSISACSEVDFWSSSRMSRKHRLNSAGKSVTPKTHTQAGPLPCPVLRPALAPWVQTLSADAIPLYSQGKSNMLQHTLYLVYDQHTAETHCQRSFAGRQPYTFANSCRAKDSCLKLRPRSMSRLIVPNEVLQKVLVPFRDSQQALQSVVPSNN